MGAPTCRAKTVITATTSNRIEMEPATMEAKIMITLGVLTRKGKIKVVVE